LRQADEVKTVILSSIAHDLKTPLATIKTSISSLRDASVGWSVEMQDEFFASIAEETDRLDRTITSLVDLNRLESEAVRPIIQPVLLQELVEEAVELASASLADRELSIDVADMVVPTDGSLLRHALANLLENAGAYSSAEGKISISATTSAWAAEIAVEDEGPGIDEGDLPFVFDRFYKGRRGSVVPGHTGLGLAIVKGFVTLCGGRVTVETSPSFTRFVISLPLAPADR
jgi:two-component system sensor histidine kinase KdpD